MGNDGKIFRRWRAASCSIVLACLTVALMGCAPFLPTLKNESDLQGPAKDFPCQRPTDVQQVPYACIEAARNELVDLENRAGYFERAVAYTALGGGTYAGYQASITHPNHSLLKHAAIGVAALAGFSQVVGADQQITAVDAGIDALDCVRKAADAIVNEKSVDVRNSNLAFQSRLTTTITLPGFSSEQLSGISQLAALRIVEFNQRSVALINAVDDAQKNVGLDVYNAVLSIRREVRRQITTRSVDAKAVYKAQQDSVNTLIGNISSKSKEQEQAAVNLRLFSAGVQVQLTDPPVTTPGKAAQDTFNACVAPPPTS